VFEETSICGSPAIGISQANFSVGPWYWIWMIVLMVSSALSMKMICSAVCSTGADCEHQNPPHACARG